MPFGLKNAPSVFQALIDNVFGILRYNCSIAYFKDIIIYSTDLNCYKLHLSKILNVLKEANLSVNITKCQVSTSSLEFQGFIVSSDGVKVDKKKLMYILAIPAPKNPAK